MIWVPSLLSDKVIWRRICTLSSWSTMMVQSVSLVTVPETEVSLSRVCIWSRLFAYESVRWVNAIWNALERSRHLPTTRPGSMRSERPLSFVSRSDGGSASTQYTPLAGGPTSGSSELQHPVQATSQPLYTTDDQVIMTVGGFAAPLVQRGSRRLAAPGLERRRSLRRVASEADLSESTQAPSGGGGADRRSVPDMLEPLTTDAARSRPGSRDFTFAGGVAPPAIVTSPPPQYSSPTRGMATSLDTIPEISTQTMATAAEILSSSGSMSTYRTPHDGTSAYHTAGIDSESGSRAFTARESQDASYITASQGQGQTARSDLVAATDAVSYQTAAFGGSIPQVQITRASASGSWESEVPPARSTIYTMANEPFETRFGTPQRTLEGSHYSTVRNSGSSYHSAPPPVPSKYHTASEMSEQDAPIRYQLHDPDVKWATASQGRERAMTGEDDQSRMITANTRMSSAFQSALSSTSPRSSQYGSAPPPPISRSSSGGDKLSYFTDAQDRAETATHISEPESDVGLLSDLERRSSIGSMMPDSARQRSFTSKTYYTANQTVGTGKTPLGTAQQNTLYETARESAYTTAQSWTTLATTAQGTQE